MLYNDKAPDPEYDDDNLVHCVQLALKNAHCCNTGRTVRARRQGIESMHKMTPYAHLLPIILRQSLKGCSNTAHC